MPKELFNQTLKTEYVATDRVATGIPGQTGCDNGLIDDFFKYIMRSAGNVAVITGTNNIDFSKTLGTTNYSLHIYDLSGIGVEVTAQSATGFTLESLGNGNINYIAIKNL